MFFETYHGLGASEMTVFRTAQQAAADIELFQADTGGMRKQGGLLTQQSVYKYSVAKGRLAQLQTEVQNLQGRLKDLQRQLEEKVRELESLGVAGAGDYLKMAGKATLSYFFPIFSVFSFAGMDIFGGDSKKKRAEALMKECEALVQQAQYWNGRIDKLQAEGEALAKAVDAGESAINVQMIQLPQHTETRDVYTDVKTPSGIVTGIIHQKTSQIVNTPEKRMYGSKVLASSDELSSRVSLPPTGDRLPVGFQTIYSPVLENGKMVAKTAQVNQALPGPVDRRVVYGGLLSGVGATDNQAADAQNLAVTSVLVVGILAYFLLDWKKK